LGRAVGSPSKKSGPVTGLDSAGREALACAARHTMTHIAIQEQLDGKVVDWMEKVSAINTADDVAEAYFSGR